MRRRRPLVMPVMCVALAALAPAAAAQELGEPPPITPDLALLAAQQAYTATPTADRIQVRLDNARSWLMVKIAPGGTPDLADASVALELGDLRVHIQDGFLTAENVRAPDVVYQARVEEITHEALLRVLPPIPVPQLALAGGWRTGNDLTPYTTDVHWATAAWDDEAGVVRLQGTAAQGPVTLELDRRSGRFIRLLAETDAGRLELIAEPVEPEDPATWKIGAEQREQVEALSALTERARPVQVGDQLQDLPLLAAAGQVRSLAALFSQGPQEWVHAADRRIVLIMAPLGSAPEDDAPDPETFVRTVLAAVDVLTGDADVGAGGLCPFAAHLVIFVRAGGFEREAVDAAAAAWDVPPERVLWSPMEMSRLAGVEPGQPAAVVVDSQRRVLAIVPAAALDGGEADLFARLRGPLQCAPGE